jgi:hypothetical protein
MCFYAHRNSEESKGSRGLPGKVVSLVTFLRVKTTKCLTCFNYHFALSAVFFNECAMCGARIVGSTVSCRFVNHY